MIWVEIGGGRQLEAKQKPTRETEMCGKLTVDVLFTVATAFIQHTVGVCKVGKKKMNGAVGFVNPDLVSGVSYLFTSTSYGARSLVEGWFSRKTRRRGVEVGVWWGGLAAMGV
ncbi:hypothetical protein L1987_48058 [Smallanthus sonchifolius]|uniref:Uncharacterized protein n=1 Tax=Smallanthus sonchifolius TaxID=185202 RepID=A0ACB9FQ98_9ASTR|nr:hypothetical protein L1987_48058 [Smallanthus sonchifolius]